MALFCPTALHATFYLPLLLSTDTEIVSTVLLFQKKGGAATTIGIAFLVFVFVRLLSRLLISAIFAYF